MVRSVGILGCGTIGTEIARAIATETVPATLSVVHGQHPDRVAAVQDQFDTDSQPRAAESISDLFEADIVIEAAGQDAVDDVAIDALEHGCECLLMSVGALADAELRSDVLEAADAGSGRLHLPSGAIAGLDAIKAAALTGELETATLQTTKPPSGLEGAPYIDANDIDLDAITEPTVVFEGPANEAASAFPSNINVAMALSLAGIGPSETAVEIVAHPDAETNTHTISATGGMGRIETTVENVPSPTNPKTSYLAAISAIEKLRSLSATVTVGT
ncbi:putative L-aspartate dehydrogenase [Natrialba chahannaoensis JCM 10990]|uniref:L-aspartate dehydrogenase n=1 Tax=Natrialba chahannaoensis JCM 10990 TaxID=1227492 RepID=M0B491_9EURY|nr:aspartate dehydrogenase [Natrialba chahannaoensis]ELZ05053.1 putative L-aspartate dehydrogenase [Natrialba chahannaoensis JCM 10990]